VKQVVVLVKDLTHDESVILRRSLELGVLNSTTMLDILDGMMELGEGQFHSAKLLYVERGKEKDSTRILIEGSKGLDELDVTPLFKINDTVQEDEADEEETTVYDLRYKCPQCEHAWEDKWSCACDSTCPKCGARNISPIMFVEEDELWTPEQEARWNWATGQAECTHVLAKLVGADLGEYVPPEHGIAGPGQRLDGYCCQDCGQHFTKTVDTASGEVIKVND
jgi:hypothetical protein